MLVQNTQNQIQYSISRSAHIIVYMHRKMQCIYQWNIIHRFVSSHISSICHTQFSKTCKGHIVSSSVMIMMCSSGWKRPTTVYIAVGETCNMSSHSNCNVMNFFNPAVARFSDQQTLPLPKTKTASLFDPQQSALCEICTPMLSC